MKIGTKSLLFGVHQFIWHPWTVLRAWRMIYPESRITVPLLIAIFCHDLGYWGCSNMDGPEGRCHPEDGARLAQSLVRLWLRLTRRDMSRTEIELDALLMLQFTRYHSMHFAQMHGRCPSPLYLADKASILIEPRWFYLLRGWLSGELKEYAENSPVKHHGPRAWFDWYVYRVEHRVRQFLAESER